MPRPKNIGAAKQNRRYWNKIVVETCDGVYSTDNEATAIRLFKKFERKYPDNPPVLGFIPADDSVMIPTYVDQRKPRATTSTTAPKKASPKA